MPPKPARALCLIAAIIAAWTSGLWTSPVSGSATRAAQAGQPSEALRQAVRDVALDRVRIEALRAADRYLETWNTRDPMAWASSLHFPHVRPGRGAFRLTQTPEDYARGVNFERTIANGWHRSQWDAYDVFQAGPEKAHVAGLYSRYNVDGERIRQTVITYIVTRHVTEDGDHWGIQARFAAGAADLDKAEHDLAGAAALVAVDAYFEALSDPIDLAGWASTLNYPHVRIADGQVEQWDTADDYMDGLQGGRLRTWAETRLDWAEAVQVGGGGVNVAVRYSRLNPLGDVLSSYEAVYLVTNRDGHVGVQARSSFAP
ncbi:MAG: hypothetical protein P8J30_10280 [Ilumatobacter sp.]|nr:hypothetical protein [Ilumatobacter sp.]